MRNSEALKLFLKASLGQKNILTVSVPLIDFTGSIHGALLLSQLVYWSDGGSDPDGWFYKEYTDWYKELRIDERTARRHFTNFISRGFLEMKRKKANNNVITHFRVDLDELCRLIEIDLIDAETRKSKRQAAQPDKSTGQNVSSREATGQNASSRRG